MPAVPPIGESTYLEPAKKHRPPLEDPSTGLRLGILLGTAVILFAIIAFRLWFLQVLSGDYYVSLANDNRVRTVVLEAPRGVIKDRDGEVLVENRAGLSVGVLPMDLRNEGDVLPKLAEILGIPYEEIAAKVNKAESRIPPRGDFGRRRLESAHGYISPKNTAWSSPASGCGSRTFVVTARTVCAHILGYVGEISETELNQERFRTLLPGAQVGKQGVEVTYDAFLRGTDGNRQVEVDATGRPKSVRDTVNPIPGNNLITTIDSQLQEAAERAVVEGIERAHADGFNDADAGVVVAMNPNTGEILAMTSYPDY